MKQVYLTFRSSEGVYPDTDLVENPNGETDPSKIIAADIHHILTNSSREYEKGTVIRLADIPDVETLTECVKKGIGFTVKSSNAEIIAEYNADYTLTISFNVEDYEDYVEYCGYVIAEDEEPAEKTA